MNRHTCSGLLDSCRVAVKQLFSDDNAASKPHSSSGFHGNQLRVEEEEEEDGYFSTYSHFAIHEEMLKV